MKTWMSLQSIILDELLRRDGLQEHTSLPQCDSCLQDRGEYQCIDCSTQLLYCSPCIVSQHENIPLHRLEVRLYSIKITFSHVRVGLECRFFRADNPTRLGSHILHWSPALRLSVHRLKDSSYSCNCVRTRSDTIPINPDPEPYLLISQPHLDPAIPFPVSPLRIRSSRLVSL